MVRWVGKDIWLASRLPAISTQPTSQSAFKGMRNEWGVSGTCSLERHKGLEAGFALVRVRTY